MNKDVVTCFSNFEIFMFYHYGHSMYVSHIAVSGYGTLSVSTKAPNNKRKHHAKENEYCIAIKGFKECSNLNLLRIIIHKIC